MLDIREIQKNPKEFEKRLQTKDPSLDVTKVISLYEELTKIKSQLETKRASLNALSSEIGEKKRKKEPTDEILEKVSAIKKEISTLSDQLASIEPEYEKELSILPNLPDPDVKNSLDPADNVEIFSWGEKPSFGFTPKNHLEINKEYGLFDFERGAKITGSGWPIYRNFGARLEWALLNLMIDTHIKNGFEFTLLPHLVKPELLYGVGQLPKFDHQLFKIKDEDYNLYLIPTAEVPLNGLHYNEILETSTLPLKYTSYTPCFRREAGAAGKGERGLIRVHQFNKVELFAFTSPEDSNKIFEEMCSSAEEVLKKLGLHYRKMLLVTGDMSFSAARTVDIEVWLPGQDRYYEVSSVSNCTDYQARRSKIRSKQHNDKPKLIHTLNGSGLATSRLMVALLENNQQEDGSIILPPALKKYLDNEVHIRPQKR